MSWNYFVPRELEANAGILCTYEEAQRAAKLSSYAGGGVVRIEIAKMLEEPKAGPLQPFVLKFANGQERHAQTVLFWFDGGNSFNNFLREFDTEGDGEPEGIAVPCTEQEYYSIRNLVATHANVPELVVQGGGTIAEGATDVQANADNEAGELRLGIPPAGNAKANYVVQFARAANAPQRKTTKSVCVNAAYLRHIWDLASVQGVQAFVRTRY